MSLKELVSKYITSAEHVFCELEIAEIRINIDVSGITKVVESAKAYLEDAIYYRDQKRFGVSLASVAYCEGLLDALKLLKAVNFEWPAEKKAKSGK
jgi:FAD synthetase